MPTIARRQSIRAAARRLAGRAFPRRGARPVPWPGAVLARLDRLPWPLLVTLGLVPAAALGWFALRSPAATALLLLLLPVADRHRVRLVWPGERAGADLAPPPPRPPVLPPVVSAPCPVHDPLIEMVQLPGGSFRMGSDEARDPQAYDDECPSREVRVSPFAMARTPITRGLYRSLVKDAPSWWRRDKDDDALPANYVSWDDALRCCNALSERSGLKPCYRQTAAGWDCDWAADGYRLPTEAEWEYACRAGTGTPWFWGADGKDAGHYAWFGTDWLTGSVHRVAQKLANPWGLHDMSGNCWEWCWDWYASPYDPSATEDPRGPAGGQSRGLRGGHFDKVPRSPRSADRVGIAPEVRHKLIGFRCVRGSGRQPLP
ncbi:formylglycine-generating enzyme family protein [Candidatus Thiodictyon syntrophicum]|jgi:formylglycine-generating enzyme required for sulfatase activity|uniref:Sulfatase-modifying factor enzyme-like domain-containing protein n=1 Tax=Candidatus Thiodictyon syntrophicum TaxID=1166950 RepID=A0A2K8UD54_9GAMM|nr:SUMF1/EgtB/PvdO family nonheme iron enzyme [Candidatus Thiodictyon syntrophicum]AUB83513.1 hypothetical protein THSYN_22890 [Candidatus Thiodictyon syntrophicum]